MRLHHIHMLAMAPRKLTSIEARYARQDFSGKRLRNRQQEQDPTSRQLVWAMYDLESDSMSEEGPIGVGMIKMEVQVRLASLQVMQAMDGALFGGPQDTRMATELEMVGITT